MKKLPLKWKLTILYTAFMTILTVVMLGVLLSLSSSEILSSVEQEMEDKVFGVSEDIQWTGKRLQLDRDFYEVENGIYLSAYNESGSLLGGRIPYEFTEDVPLEEGLRKISAGDIQWDIRDTILEVSGYGTVWVRGITSITDAESSLRITIRFSLVLFPLMVALAAVLGYLFVRRAFRPVARLTATAREIYEKEDLSKRIGLTGEKNEIYVMAETFDMMLDKLEASFEKEKRFTSDASHELRTPVTVILSQCDYLLEDRDLSEEERSAVEAIRRKARSMSKMISQLLFLSRADQGRQAVHKELLDLSLITEMAADEQEEMAAEKNISIVRDIGEGIEGYVDETLFIRLWMNLIGNAISYGKEGGWLKVSLKKEKNTVFGAVEDNGIGISQEQLPHIWERFYQADTSRTGKENAGSGLGLPMVKWIVETHGGKISVRSTPGAGSRFAFYLPLDPTAEPNAGTGEDKDV